MFAITVGRHGPSPITGGICWSSKGMMNGGRLANGPESERRPRMHHTYTVALICLASAVMAAPRTAQAGRNDVLVGMDEKTFFEADGMRFGPGGKDSVAILDVTDPGHPKIRASLPLSNSVLGPPTNLQITPDGRLGLVANSVVTTQSGDKWTTTPDDKLYVIDLTADPPKLADTVTVGKQPSGLSIAHQGDLALIANRGGKSCRSSRSRVTGPRGWRGADGGRSRGGCHHAGRKARLRGEEILNKVAVLSIDGQKVTYDKFARHPDGRARRL